MRVWRAMGAGVAALGVRVLVLGATPACGTSCETRGDCFRSAEAQALGQCANKLSACVEGTCRVDCATSCSVADPAVDPCGGGKVCNEPVKKDEDGVIVLGADGKPRREQGGTCTPYRIPCASAAECPRWRPRSDAEWTCEGSTCAFPGFEYALD